MSPELITAAALGVVGGLFLGFCFGAIWHSIQFGDDYTDNPGGGD